jgi:basic membrane protein A
LDITPRLARWRDLSTPRNEAKTLTGDFMKFKSVLTGVLLAFGLGTAAVAADVKVGFVYVGPIGDGGWTYEHDKGRLAVEKHFGDRVETIYQENVPEGADAERVMTTMAMQGADLIFTTSFGYMDPTINVAKKFPNVKFEHATGYKRSDNVSTYSARFYEGRAIQGHIAGKMTKTNKVGYIASFPIPEVIRGINSAYIHAKKVNPDIEFNIIWVYTWFDPAKEADAAKALIDQGADVVLQHTDSTAPQAAAKEAGNVITFGQASDMGEYAPMPRVSSIIDDWAPYYIARTQAVLDGTWESVDTWDGIGPGMVGIGEISDAVPADVKAEAMAMRDAIANGTYHPFTGPIKKQDGSDWLGAGETSDDGTLLGMNFYVEGITAEVPK